MISTLQTIPLSDLPKIITGLSIDFILAWGTASPSSIPVLISTSPTVLTPKIKNAIIRLKI
jgi:hypothetical protein